MTALSWPMERAERVCLGPTRDRTSCQSRRAKFLSGNQTRSVHSEPRHKFSITGSLFHRFCGILQADLHSYGKERHSGFFWFGFSERHRRFARISQRANDKQTHKGRLLCSLCENVPRTYRRSTHCIFLWTFEDHYTIKDDRFVSPGPGPNAADRKNVFS